MKKHLLILCAVAMLCNSVSCSKTDSSTSGTSSITERETVSIDFVYDCEYENKYFKLKYPKQWTKSTDEINDERGCKFEITEELYIYCISIGPYYDDYKGMTNADYISSILNSIDNSKEYTSKSGVKYANFKTTSNTAEKFLCLNYPWVIEFEFDNFSADEEKIITDFIDCVEIKEQTESSKNTTQAKSEKETTKSTTTEKQTTEKTTEKTTETKSEISTEFLNALKKADSYANNQHMSKAKLYEQLTSEYGEHFSQEAANYAVENVSTDYNQNALIAADSYANKQHMSKLKLYEQLTSEYGEEFSESEAQYAVDNVQTDYNYNALQTAKSYQEHQAMSKESIYEQLVSEYGEGFTAEEAQYAIDNLE